MNAKNTKGFPVWLFGVIFLAVLGVVIISRILSPAQAQIYVTDYSTPTELLSQGQNLIAVFEDGTIAAWNWINPSGEPLWKFSAGDQFVMLDDTRAAVISKTERKNCTVYDVKTGKKISEMSVGWQDQDIRLLQSPDKKVLVLACIYPDKDGHTLYEFMTIDPAKTKPDMPVPVDVLTAQKRLMAFAVSNDKKITAAGNEQKKGCLTIVDLDKNQVVLEKQYDQADEFTSIASTPDNSLVFLTNLNGSVYGIDMASGEVKTVYTVLKPGQKNSVTNETSSQNVAISEDGKYVAAVVINVVHIWEIESGRHIFQKSPGHMLTGPIVFSSDGSLLASSDIRAGRLIKIWKIKK